MNASTRSQSRVPRLIRRMIPRSVVARTSLSILVMAVVMGLVFSIMASWRVRAAEQERLISRVHELAATVEDTVSIATFLSDATLAKEIAGGLMKNRVVAGVRITSGAVVLYADGDPAISSDVKPGSVGAVAKSIHSPFDANAVVGEITIYYSRAEIEAQAATYSRYTIWVMGLQVLFVAGAVAFLVYLLVTRPIKGISDELHHLEIRSGMHLTVPPTRRKDEIGQLVVDVNGLITRLSDALSTERDLRRAHEFSERRMRLVFEKADTGLVVVDDQGGVQSCNPAFVRILGPEAARPRVQLAELLAPHGALVAALIADSLATGQPCDADLEIECLGRGKIWVELSVNPLGANLLQGLVNDITERKRAEAAAQELATRDAVTGLLNRRGFDAALAKLLASLRDHPRQLAVLQVDLDFFKAVNDTHGHEAGDEVLREVARVLERCVRRSDVVGRTGGDEFVVLLPGVEGAEKAQDIARHIIAGVSRPIALSDGNLARIGASIGIALTSNGEEPAAALLRRADVAMYAAKQAGRGQAFLAQHPSEDPSETAAA
jgi:diguanylate cyclase (GGDEF)-like protein/PAS domain S-box-containing protein